MSRRRHGAARRHVFELMGERGARVTMSELAGAVGHLETLLALPISDVVQLACDLSRANSASEAAPRSIDRWTEAVRDVLADSLRDPSPSPSLQRVARALAVSPRTLQRRLAAEGTTWRDEIEAVRRARAGELMKQGLTAQVVALRVGYSSSRALRRALRRWQGQ